MKTLIIMNIPKIVSLVIIVILVIGGGAFLTSPAGEVIFSSLMGNFPLFNYSYSLYKQFLGFQETLPSLDSISFINDLTKLLIITLTADLIFRLLTRIFNYVNIPKNQILDNGRTYEYIEERRKSISYRIKNFLITLTSKLFGAYAGISVSRGLTELTDGVKDDARRGLVSVLVLLFVFCGYCLIRSLLSGTGIHFQIFKTFIFTVLPEMLSTFVTTSILLIIYFDVNENSFSFTTLLFVFVLLLWCALSDWLCSKLQVHFVQQSSSEKSLFYLPNCFAGATFYLYVFTFYFLGYVAGGKADYFDDFLFKLLFNLKEFPYVALVNNDTLDLMSVLKEMPKILLFAVLVSVFQKLVRGNSGKWRMLVDNTTLVAVIMLYSMILYCYNNFELFPVVAVAVIVILMLFKRFYSLVNIFECLCIAAITTFCAVVLVSVFSFTTEFIYGVCIAMLLSNGIWFITKKIVK